jgi:zinc transporter ZupT
MKEFYLLLALTFAASFLGGLLPAVEQFMERVGPDLILSFRSGILVCVAAFDVLPQAWHASPLTAALSAAGALALGFRLHHAHAGEHAGHELTHPHIHAGDRAHLPSTLVALVAHAGVDGLNLGAVAIVGGPALFAIGAATSLHKLADGFTVVSLFHRSGYSRRVVLTWLGLVSLATPIGALLGRSGVVALGPLLAALLLGFAGGSFLFVGGAQVLPLRKRRRPAGPALAFAAGLAAILALHASA